jgi:hypothetical protein
MASMKLLSNVPCVDTKRAAPADWTERAARRAAPKDLAMATMMAVLEGVSGDGTEMG